MKKIKKDNYFELCVFLMDYHSGQWSRGYRILCKLSPRNLTATLCDELRETEIYKHLEREYSKNV